MYINTYESKQTGSGVLRVDFREYDQPPTGVIYTVGYHLGSMATPSVTVAVATYDPDDQLRAALDSIAAQRYDGPISAVVLDNTETPAAEAIVDEFPFADYHWQLNHVPRQSTGIANLAVARDLGVQFADGDYVHFLNDDDVLDPDAISKKIDSIHQHPQARGAYSAIQKADGTVKHVPQVVLDNPLTFTLANLRPPTLPSALLVDREVLLDCPPRRTLPHEDICGLIEILLRTPLAYVDEPLLRRTTPPGMSTGQASQQGRLDTHERYAGLRAELLKSQLQHHAQQTADQLRQALTADECEQ